MSELEEILGRLSSPNSVGVDTAEEFKLVKDRAEAWYPSEKCRFKKGDFIKARSDATVKESVSGVVIDTRDAPAPYFFGETGNVHFGKRLDVRILSIDNGDFVPMWVESAEFELCEPPTATSEDESED